MKKEQCFIILLLLYASIQTSYVETTNVEKDSNTAFIETSETEKLSEMFENTNSASNSNAITSSTLNLNANTNANTNTNTNLNASSNANASTNLNASSNANSNTNSNAISSSNTSANTLNNSNKNANTISSSNKNSNTIASSTSSENMFSSMSSLGVNEQMQIEASLQEMFYEQIVVEKKTRFTEGGLKCQESFVANGKTYNDCTTDRAPDGVKYNKEWCYIDITMRTKNLSWTFCKPNMDYDMVRRHNQKALEDISVEANKVESEIKKAIRPGEEVIQELGKILRGQADLDNKINNLTKQVKANKDRLIDLMNKKKIWEQEEANIIKIAGLIEKMKKLVEHKKKLKGNKIIYFNKQDAEKAAKENTREVFSMVFQRRVKDDNKNCENMFNYEDEPLGDGIIGKYYDNEFLQGKYYERKDDQIDFEWKAFTPMNEINLNNYSIKWEGYLQAPMTTDYIFTIETDDGAAFVLNNKLLIAHNLHTLDDESLQRTQKFLESVRKNNREGQNDPLGRYKSVSKPIRLIAGSRFKIVVTYFRSSHNQVIDRVDSFIKLKWSTAEMEQATIRKQYLYSKNPPVPLKITAFDDKLILFKILKENDLFFKNSDKFIIQDIPTIFYGSKVIKFPVRYNKKEIRFTINTAQMIYIARLSHYPNPFEEDFILSKYKMSILQFDTLPKNPDNIKKVQATKSGVLLFYEKFFPPGEVVIPLKLQGANARGVPGLLILFRINNFFGGAYPDSCGGYEINVSNPASAAYYGCSQSSYSSGNKCEFGLNGKMQDKFRQMWWSKAEGVGAWLKVSFQTYYYLTRFEFKNRANVYERNSQIQVMFSNGEKRLFDIKNNEEVQNFELGNIKTENITFTIIGVYGSINNGGSFNVYGIKCSTLVDFEKSEIETQGLSKLGLIMKEYHPIFGKKKRDPIIITCDETLQSTNKFEFLKLNKRGYVVIRCPDACSDSSVPIYGNGVYSKDSAICKAAFHAEKISANGGLVKLFFNKGRKNYSGGKRNGIHSYTRGKTDFSFTFEVYEEDDDIIIKEYSLVDLLSENGVDWLPGVITKVEVGEDGKKILTIQYEKDKKIITVKKVYPDTKFIHACGEHLFERNCQSSRRGINKSRPFRIRFVPKNYKKKDLSSYYYDYGEVFGATGRPYGWNRIMTNRIKMVKNPSKPIMESFIKFPPTVNSKYCSEGGELDTMCEIVDWTIKVGDGSFIVDVIIGDDTHSSKIDLKVNGEYIVENQVIPKGVVKSYQKKVEAINKYLIFTSECKTNCEFSMVKINSIEITPDIEKEGHVSAGAGFSLSSEENLCGGRRPQKECENTEDVLHCVYGSFTPAFVSKCTGNSVVMEIPSDYKCKDQRSKFKCVRREYLTSAECVMYCPKKCNMNKCVY